MSGRTAFIAELSDSLAARRPRERAFRIGVDGMSCAGKSRFADALSQSIAASGCAPPRRLSLDDFHAPAETRYRQGRDSAEGYYSDCFENTRFRTQVLDPLGHGRYPLSIPTAIFDYRTDRPIARTATIEASDIVIVDGLFLLRPELAGGWDMMLVLDIDESDAFRRARERDLALFGSEAEIERRYRERYNPAWRFYCKEAQPLARADLVIDHRRPENPRYIRRAWTGPPSATPSD